MGIGGMFGISLEIGTSTVLRLRSATSSVTVNDFASTSLSNQLIEHRDWSLSGVEVPISKLQ